MLPNCQSCKGYTQPQHAGDLTCALNPGYTLLWAHRLGRLPDASISTMPINPCKEFEELPPYNLDDPCIRQSPDGL